MGSGAEQADAIRDAEATDHSFKPGPFRTLADNPDLKTLADGRSHQHIEALVGDELSAGEHEPSATAFGVVIVGALHRPIILRDIDAERNDVTFLSEFSQIRLITTFPQRAAHNPAVVSEGPPFCAPGYLFLRP
jgi:hypothetical protein